MLKEHTIPTKQIDFITQSLPDLKKRLILIIKILRMMKALTSLILDQLSPKYWSLLCAVPSYIWNRKIINDIPSRFWKEIARASKFGQTLLSLQLGFNIPSLLQGIII
jgi:hypothetical protein